MASSRKPNQPSFNIFTGAPESPPPAREPLRETFRSTLRTSHNAPPHTVLPADPVNEDLRAQLNTLRYELETAKQDNEMLKLEHQQEKRDLENRAEAEFKKAQQAEKSNNLTAKKLEALQKEISESNTRSANERQDLERRLRTSQEKAQQLQEEADELKDDLATSLRQHEHKFKTLQAEQKTLKDSMEEVRTDLDAKVNVLQTTQKKLSQKEAEVGELESEVLRLKAITGDAETLAVIKRELSEQVAHIKKLETLTREQNAELRQYRKQHKAIEVVEEEKRDLQSKVRMMDDLRRELGEAQLRKQVLEDERDSWTSYLENEAQNEIQFQTPEDLARAYIRERLEKTDLMNKLGEIKPELSVREANIQALEDEKAKLQAEIQRLKTTENAAPNSNEVKTRARLERQKALAMKEVEFLRAQVKAFDEEEREMQPETFDGAKSARIKELENLVDKYREEINTLQVEFNAIEKPVSVAAGQKRSLDTEEADERVGELRRKNRELQDENNEFHKRIKVLESDYKAQNSQLKKLKETSRTRVLELKSNPTADAEALKLSTVRSLREANAELLARLEGTSPAANSVPLATLAAAQDEIAELTHTVAERDKRIKRLKQIWTAKSLEFREAVASILGWKLDFMPNGRVRVTSMFYPGDLETGENSIVFDGENGTMKVSGGEQSAFANEIRDLITFWVEERKEIPCFLAAMTLEFWERTTRAARIDVPRRLRRAILLNDLSLVKRIVHNNPKYLLNPDFEDKSNTSLHLAAKHGFTAIAEFLIETGHEEEIVSRNNDWETPLMLAAVAGKEDMGVMLAKRFPECVPWQNKQGLDALMLSCKSGTGTLHLIPTLLNLAPSILNAHDQYGNTALHHASAAGELKALRMLLQYGANPLAQNAYSWTPVHYSATPAAEAYFKTLIIEFEKKKAEGAREKRERERQRNAGVRLVTNEDAMQGMTGERHRARDDAAIAGLPAPGMEWSPVERRRAMTPTESRTGWGFTAADGARPRAGSGD